MAGVPLNVVGGLVEVAHPGDVVLPGDTHHAAVVGDDNSRVPQDLAVDRVAFQDGRDDDHVILIRVLFQEHLKRKLSAFSVHFLSVRLYLGKKFCRRSILCRFGKFAPRLLFASAKCKRHSYKGKFNFSQEKLAV